MSDFGNYRWPVARKTHRCEWCGEQINVGEKHFQFVGVYQDEWQNWRMHQECQEVYSLNDDGESFSPFENERPTSPVQCDNLA